MVGRGYNYTRVREKYHKGRFGTLQGEYNSLILNELRKLPPTSTGCPLWLRKCRSRKSWLPLGREKLGPVPLLRRNLKPSRLKLRLPKTNQHRSQKWRMNRRLRPLHPNLPVLLARCHPVVKGWIWRRFLPPHVPAKLVRP